MDKITRNLLIGLAILVILCPLGLISGFIGWGDAFGEWGTEFFEEAEDVGYIPAGLDQLSTLWSAPLPDYGWGDATTVGTIAGYMLSAIIGVVLCGGLLYLFGKVIAKKETE